jgi:hypothetical protein
MLSVFAAQGQRIKKYATNLLSNRACFDPAILAVSTLLVLGSGKWRCCCSKSYNEVMWEGWSLCSVWLYQWPLALWKARLLYMRCTSAILQCKIAEYLDSHCWMIHHDRGLTLCLQVFFCLIHLKLFITHLSSFILISIYPILLQLAT